MREIKFRAWVLRDDENDEVMEYMDYDIKSWCDPLEQHEIGNIILLQYTGLKDVNGKEIYEGDLVRCKNSVEPIEFYEGCFGFGKVYMLYHVVNEGCEVVGNIYEK